MSAYFFKIVPGVGSEAFDSHHSARSDGFEFAGLAYKATNVAIGDTKNASGGLDRYHVFASKKSK